MKKVIIILSIVIVAAAAGLLYFFIFMKDLSDSIIIPYIAHQKPRIDPHVSSVVPIADKLDEVMFDGLFNVSANPSGITYEDGLGELMGIDEDNIVALRLKPQVKWHSSFNVMMEKKKITVSEKSAVYYTAKDLKFTLRRIKKLGSLSPDYILVSQAVEDLDFTGPDENDEIRFQFRGDRIWTDDDIKEVLSFKILPANSELNAPMYKNGTGPYLMAGEYEDAIYFYKNLAGNAHLTNVILRPFIDNSTYTTEIKNKNINSLLSTPFGSVSPLLSDTGDFFSKSSIATCFFALFHNVERLSLQQRFELRKLVDNVKIVERFFKINTEQQRHIADYKGNVNNYSDYLNYSIFPSTSYYVQEKIVLPLKHHEEPDASLLPDTVRVQTCLNFGSREELAELVEIFNDPSLFGGKIKVTAVQNKDIALGNYDAVLVPISGYRSNFLFDLYNIFFREPTFAAQKIHLKTYIDDNGERIIDERTFTASKNFFRLDLGEETEGTEQIKTLLDYIYGFMATREVGDKQEYAKRVDELDQEMALGCWLFSLPSMAYFRTQFDASSIDLYGVASQLSTIEKWQERMKK